MTLRSVVIAWTALAAVAWVVFAAIPAGSQKGCTPNDWICLDAEAILLVLSIYVAVGWLLGLLLIGAIAGIVWWHRKLTSYDP